MLSSTKSFPLLKPDLRHPVDQRNLFESAVFHLAFGFVWRYSSGRLSADFTIVSTQKRFQVAACSHPKSRTGGLCGRPLQKSFPLLKLESPSR